MKFIEGENIRFEQVKFASHKTTKIWKPVMARDFHQGDEIHHKKVLNVTKG